MMLLLLMMTVLIISAALLLHRRWLMLLLLISSIIRAGSIAAAHTVSVLRSRRTFVIVHTHSSHAFLHLRRGSPHRAHVHLLLTVSSPGVILRSAAVIFHGGVVDARTGGGMTTAATSIGGHLQRKCKLLRRKNVTGFCRKNANVIELALIKIKYLCTVVDLAGEALEGEPADVSLALRVISKA